MTVDAKGLLKVAPEASPSTTNILATVEEEVGLNLYTSWVVEVRHFDPRIIHKKSISQKTTLLREKKNISLRTHHLYHFEMVYYSTKKYTLFVRCINNKQLDI